MIGNAKYKEIIVPQLTEEEKIGKVWERLHPGITFNKEDNTVSFTDEALEYAIKVQKELKDKLQKRKG